MNQKKTFILHILYKYFWSSENSHVYNIYPSSDI